LALPPQACELCVCFVRIERAKTAGFIEDAAQHGL
jgi:hypothetical protein